MSGVLVLDRREG